MQVPPFYDEETIEIGDCMAFARVPCEPRNQINKAGKILAYQNGSFEEDFFLEALELANNWRACHAYPINTFQATLRVG